MKEHYSPPPSLAIETIDLNFQGIPGTIACYLIPHARGAVLIESGPGSTLPALQAALQAWGLKASDISDVLLTHIHLDHAGAAGWLARQGARIHVHHLGAQHLLNPEKLLSSAARIYGEMMETLWGEFLAVPEDRLSVLKDQDVVVVENLHIRALETPGHAKHHLVYLFQGVCFSGDIGGVRLGGLPYLRLPTPPPEFHLEEWRASLSRLKDEARKGSFERIAPTHFGIFSDAGWHLEALEQALDDLDDWMQVVMPSAPPIEHLTQQFLEWTRQRALKMGIQPKILEAFETSNPSWMSPYGIQRYWNKHHQPSETDTPKSVTQ